MSFTSVDAFDGGIVHLVPEPQRTLRALMAALAATFPETPPYEGAFREPVPHLTVARAADPGDGARLLRSIRDGLAPQLPLTAPVREVSIMVQRAGGAWSTIQRMPLGR